MNYRLLNSSDPNQSLTLTLSAWLQVLELAAAHDWNPLGTVELDRWLGLSAFDLYDGPGSYTPVTRRLVVLDDAINLADALDRAFLDHEPLPFGERQGVFQTEWDDSTGGALPGIGVITALVGFCRQGEFWVEGCN